MELLYNHLLDRKRFTEAEFVARLGVPVLIYRPGGKSELSPLRTSTLREESPNVEWANLRGVVRDEAHGYRVLRLMIEGTARERIVRIGRGSNNDIVLNHSSVSKNHAALHVQASGVSLFDLGSKNGTQLGARAVGETPINLTLPVKLTLGSIELRCVDAVTFYAFLGDLLVVK